MRKVEVVSKRTIREKLLAYLSIQTQTQNSRYFEIPLGRVELAEYLCVDRSALTRELVKMKEDGLRKGDTLVVHEFDRLGRNKKLTLKELEYFKNNGIRLIALNLPTTQLDTTDNVMLETINNIVIELYTMMAQQEIETREKRQREGIDIALANGVKFGRREIEYPKNWESVIQLVDNKQINNIEAMTMLGLKKTTYYKLLKEYRNK